VEEKNEENKSNLKLKIIKRKNIYDFNEYSGLFHLILV
jgi:hypothetical protein